MVPIEVLLKNRKCEMGNCIHNSGNGPREFEVEGIDMKCNLTHPRRTDDLPCFWCDDHLDSDSDMLVGKHINFQGYQMLASRTMKKYYATNQKMALADYGMGLAGESAGEVTDYLKKVAFHEHKMDVTHLEKELGDALWYIASICTSAGISMEKVAKDNISKLVDRYPEGYKSEDSVNRKEYKKS